MPSSSDDEYFMTLALAQASRGIGLTNPNPPVGAVLVRDGELIGEGYHHKAGKPHAEIEALQDAMGKGRDVRGATIYVTLEPCSTRGRTPACTKALIHAGVGRVVYALPDPNPQHAGSADKLLRKAGIEVESGLLEEECTRLIRPFEKWITRGLPYVIAKSGQSLDGRITRPPGESQNVTSKAAREHAMQLRIRCDAILIGAETLRQDDPKLTVRGDDIPEDKKQPWRVVVTRSGKLPRKSHLFTDEHKKRTIVLEGDHSFKDILRELAKRDITCVLLEGGGNLLGQAFAARAVDECFWYLAPRICAGGTMSVGGIGFPEGASSVELSDVWHEMIGDNLLVHGYPVWE
jgi:diaminohydroxyphosphoribosylaminopyrimidine deaminase/5-amino-6-(5-phosphoribosylamino)uracil reductase